MIKRWLSWSEIPLALGATVLFIAAALLIAQLILTQIRPGKPMKLDAALFGVVQPPVKIPLAIANVLNSTYQTAAAHQIGAYEPFYATAVRMRNQVEYTIFGVLPVADIIYGTNAELLDAGYNSSYCNRNLKSFMVFASDWASKIRQMQNDVEANGQTFLYVITPSKVALYPNYLPVALPCAASTEDRTGLIPTWMALMQQQGIHVVDTITLLRAAENNYPFPLFPRGGIHWNQVGSAIGAQGVDAGIAVQRRDGSFTPFSFTWAMSPHPTGMDADLANLMNLFWLPDKYSNVPAVTFIQSPAPIGCHKIKIVIVGGSFMESVGSVLSRLPCVADVVEYFYWHTNRYLWVDGVMTSGTVNDVNPAQRDAELRQADVLIYEENEALIGPSGLSPGLLGPSSAFPGPKHGQAFYQWLNGSPDTP